MLWKILDLLSQIKLYSWCCFSVSFPFLWLKCWRNKSPSFSVSVLYLWSFRKLFKFVISPLQIWILFESLFFNLFGSNFSELPIGTVCVADVQTKGRGKIRFWSLLTFLLFSLLISSNEFDMFFLCGSDMKGGLKMCGNHQKDVYCSRILYKCRMAR